MANEYDVVVAGGGSNGLVLAGYLAKAGLNVCVVEKQPFVGGGVISQENTLPGFIQDPASVGHVFIQANPLLVNDELGLKSKYGLKYVFPEVPVASLYADGRTLCMYKDVDKTCQDIAKFSTKDAEAYKQFHEWAQKVFGIVIGGFWSPPPPYGALISLLEQSYEGREVLRLLTMSALDLVNEWFESDQVKILITRFASEVMVAPQEKGTAVAGTMMVPILHKYGMAVPVGGSKALSESLERCIKDLGGTIRTSSTIKRFKVVNGEVKGVVLESGEEILAKRAVVSNLNVKQVFPDMVGEENVPAEFVHGVKRIAQNTYQPLHQNLALNEAPKYKAGGDINKAFFLEFAPATLEEYLQEFDKFFYGGTSTVMPLVIAQTLFDPSRAPEGKHTLYLYHYEPYNIKGGAAKWDEIKQKVADDILKTVQDYTTNMGPENILGRWISSPLDFARFNPAWPGGDFLHIGQFPHQFLSNRPLPGWGQYRTPVKNLYLCGPSAHPGGSVTGGGRAPVQVVMEDLGIDFQKVIG